MVEFFEGMENGPAQQASQSELLRIRIIGLCLAWATLNLGLLALGHQVEEFGVATIAMVSAIPIGWCLWRYHSGAVLQPARQISLVYLGATLGALFAVFTVVFSFCGCVGNLG